MGVDQLLSSLVSLIGNGVSFSQSGVLLVRMLQLIGGGDDAFFSKVN